MYNNYVRTIDWGNVPIRKTFTDGMIQDVIELSDNGTNECYAIIKTDFRTNQPFCVLADENLKEITK